jgi:hypothetical protein
MTECLDCGKTWGGSRMEHCPVPGCHQTFAGASAGDHHRTGEFGVSEGPGRRRCRTPEEMRSYQTKAGATFWQGANGVWHFGHRREFP